MSFVERKDAGFLFEGKRDFAMEAQIFFTFRYFHLTLNNIVFLKIRFN